MEARQVITPGDAELLRIYAVAYTRHERALDKLAVEGEICVYVRLDSNGQAHDQEKPNLWLKVAQDAERTMVACLDWLGLTPLNRNKVRPTANAPAQPTPEQEEYASFANLIDGKGKAVTQ